MKGSDQEQRLDCGHTSGELSTWRDNGVFTDHGTGEKVCQSCSDSRHYARVRERYAELKAKGSAEGWTYEYIDTPYDSYVRRRELIGKLVCRAYWRHQDSPHWGIEQPAHMYHSAFKRLKDVVTNSPVTGFALEFEDGSRESLCYDKICVITREPVEVSEIQDATTTLRPSISNVDSNEGGK